MACAKQIIKSKLYVETQSHQRYKRAEMEIRRNFYKELSEN
jgi:hypothetical protein